MALKFVIAWEEEQKRDETADPYLTRLLSGLHKYGAEAFLIPAAYAQEKKLAEILKENALDPTEGLVLAATDHFLEQAAELPIATVGFLNPAFPGQSLSVAQILVEGFEEVDFYFLERIYNRKHKIPWRVIDTKRCYLREMTEEDLDALYELYAGTDMTKYMEPLYADRREEAEYMQAYIASQYYYYGYGMWVVIEQATGKLIGRAGLDNRKIHGKIELEMGYAIAADRHRQGYATEVCLAIIHYARQFLEFPRINCLVNRENEASVQLLLKLGFSQKEELEIDGERMQRYLYTFPEE
mgnify:CR=1 FL=1